MPVSSATRIPLSRRALARVRAGHPWIFRSDLPAEATPRADVVHLVDEQGRFLASALSSSSSQIALRVISAEPLEANQATALIAERLRAAIAYRASRYAARDAFRIVFSEADGLPGFVADKYHDVITVQALTQFMDREDVRSVLFDGLQSRFLGCSIVERVDSRVRQLEELPAIDSRLLRGERTATRFRLNGLRFGFDALGGQKTGAFLDQQQNYARAEEHAFGECLDVFTYHGGFALHLARKCERVTAVDASRAALQTAEANEQANRSDLGCPEIEWIEADAFELLKDFSHPQHGRKFDTVVLDPPAFAKSKRAVAGALRGYKEINLRALKMLRPNGILVTNSCSFHVSAAEFQQALAAAAADAGRNVKILERRSAAIDHPAVPTIPESDYLKCFICHVS
jgi:23S rRNA (cytosine1962-C5)-methyltransferase